MDDNFSGTDVLRLQRTDFTNAATGVLDISKKQFMRDNR
jgi:hypothetical protein